MTYDSAGRKLTMTDPDMGSWSYAYDLAGNLLRQTDAKGQVLEFTYDSLNRLTQKQGRSSTTASPSTLSTYTYDDAAKQNCVGRLSKVADPGGSTEFFYDRLGREIKSVKSIDSSSFTVRREFDPLNRLTRLIYPDGTDLRYEYSPQGIKRIYSVNPDSSTLDYLTDAGYNSAGETLQLKLGNGLTTDYTYDPKTLRISSIRTTDAAGKTLQDFGYNFDAVGNLAGLTDRWNTATQNFQYDSLNRLAAATGNYGAYQYRYDALGNLLQKDNGVSLTYGLSNGSKPHAVTQIQTYAAGTKSLSYDANGNLIQKGTDQLTYDLENRLTQVTRQAPADSGTITYSLSPGWNLIGIPFEDIQGKTVPTVFNTLRKGTDYDQLSSKDVSSGKWLSYVGDSRFDQFSALSSCQSYEIYVANPAGVQFTLNGKLSSTRPVKSLVAGWNLIPSPVLADTPVAQALAGLTAGTDYDEIVRYNPATKTWTAVAACKPGEAYWIHTLAAKNWTFPAPTVQKTTTFTYDGDGGRTKVGVNGQTDRFVGSLYEILSSGASKAHIFFGPTRLASLERTSVLTASANSSSIKRFFQGVEEVFVGKAYADTLPPGLAIRFYHGDHLGSINLITDQTGAQVELAEYKPFGSFSRKEVSPASPPSPVSPSSPYFTGHRLDSGTQLYYYGARYYDPDLGRFTQPDTIVQAPSDPQTLNRYTYVRNNPLIYTDPTGHSFWKKAGKIIRQWVAPIAAVAVFFISGGNVALAAATYSYYATAGANLERGRGYFESVGRGILAAGATYAGARIGGGIGGGFGTFWEGFGTAVGAGAAGGASTAGLSGGDPLLGAAAGAAAGAVGSVLGGIGGNLGRLGNIARAGAVGSASGAASGAIFGDAGGGAWRGAASAIAVAIAAKSLQAAIDGGRSIGGGPQADKAIAQSALSTQEVDEAANGIGTLRRWARENLERIVISRVAEAAGKVAEGFSTTQTFSVDVGVDPTSLQVVGAVPTSIGGVWRPDTVIFRVTVVGKQPVSHEEALEQNIPQLRQR